LGVGEWVWGRKRVRENCFVPSCRKTIPVMTPLEGDPSRQAIPSLKGYIYQIWQSVYAWLELEEGEVLYLEGAEDIDRLRGGKVSEAEAIQVKDLAGAVTLRSRDVLSSIEHYWEHKSKNRDSDVYFRFLTTAERGLETARPFGKIKGLDYWDQIKEGEDPSEMREYLEGVIKGESKYGKLLKDFINSASKDKFRNELVRKIEWDTGREKREYLQRNIERKVVEYGDRVHDLPSWESKKAVPHLLEYVADLICNESIEKRKLDRLKFVEVFENALLKKVSIEEQKRLKRARRQLNELFFENFESTERREIILGKSVLEEAPSHSDDRLLERETLIDKILRILKETGIANLTGITGIGKSVLAGFVAEKDNGAWKKLSLGKTNYQVLKNKLQIATTEIREGTAHNLLIDDAFFGEKSGNYAEDLASLVDTLRRRGKKVLVTSQAPVTISLRMRMDMKDASVLNVPRLEQNEIGDLIRLYVPDMTPAKIDEWEKTIFLISRGHPQLAHARIKFLDQRNWPDSELFRIQQSTPEIEVKKETRVKLRGQIPSPDSRELAYRLSVFVGSFERGQAIHLAKALNPIERPVEALDLLVGPYLERLSRSTYRLTPLLEGVAQDNYDDQELRKLHTSAGESIISGEMTPIDLRNLYFHSFKGRSPNLLAVAIQATFSVDDEAWPDVSEYLDLVMYVNTDNGKDAFGRDPALSLLLRDVQFQIASSQGKWSHARKIAKLWWGELEKHKAEHIISSRSPGKDWRGSKNHFYTKFYLTILPKLQLSLTPSEMAKWSCHAMIIAQDLGNKIQPSNVPGSLTHFADNYDWSTFPLEAISLRGHSFDQIVQFLNAIRSYNGFELLVDKFEDNHHLARRLIDQVWSAPLEDEEPNWNKVVDQLKQLLEEPTVKASRALTASVYRGLAIVEFEYKGDRDAALGYLRSAEDQLEGGHPLVSAYRSSLFVQLGSHRKALGILEGLLEDWNQIDQIELSFRFRDAGICAGELGEEEKAINYFQRGEEAAAEVGNQVMQLGFRMEQIWIHWISGARTKVPSALREVIDALEEVPNPTENLRSLGLHKLVEAAMLWMVKEVSSTFNQADEFGSVKPYFGIFTALEEKEEFRSLPFPGRPGKLSNLAVLAHELGVDVGAFEELKSIRQKLPPLFRRQLLALEIRKSLQAEQFCKLLEKVVEDTALLEHASRLEGDDLWRRKSLQKEELLENISRQHVELVLNPLAQFLIATQDAETAREVILEWKQELDSIQVAHKQVLQDGIEKFQAYFDDLSEAQNVLNSSADTWERFLAGVAVSMTTDSPVWLCYGHVVCCDTLIRFDRFDWTKELAIFLEDMIMSKWMDVVNNKRFALSSPNVTGPMVREACADPGASGLSKVAQILLNATKAVDLKLPQEIKGRFEERVDMND
jgi:hypothetical protein